MGFSFLSILKEKHGLYNETCMPEKQQPPDTRHHSEKEKGEKKEKKEKENRKHFAKSTHCINNEQPPMGISFTQNAKNSVHLQDVH